MDLIERMPECAKCVLSHRQQAFVVVTFLFELRLDSSAVLSSSVVVAAYRYVAATA